MDNRFYICCRFGAVLTLFFAGCMLVLGCSQATLQNGVIYRPEVEISEEDIPSYTSKEYEARGDGGFKRGDLQVAFLNYERALRLKPKNQNLRSKRAWVLLAGNFNDEAVIEFETVLSQNKNSVVAREGLGQAYFQMQRYEEALDEFKKSLAMDPTRWRSHNFIGIIYNHQNEPLRAIQEFTAAIAIRPDNGILYNNLGMAYNLAGQYTEALASYKKAYEFDAPREKNLNNLGIVLVKTGRIQRAEDAFKEVGDEARAYNNLGCVYMSEGDYEMAAKSFETAVRLSSEPYTKAIDNLKKCRKMMKRTTPPQTDGVSR
jgi:tetratricopeptide (TPR) repeat protein